MKNNSNIDKIIIDLIMDHYNAQSYSGSRQNLSSTDFDNIVDMAESIYLKKIIITEKPALA
tara:strand:+ start:366 stop:548 length:183 start_codon:yes stop_codon:yes gene_type:complete